MARQRAAVMTYVIAVTNVPRGPGNEVGAHGEAQALSKAALMSTKDPGVSYGVYEVRHGEGACLIASFLNGERRFTALSEPQS